MSIPELAADLRKSQRLVVLTGAGMGLASGIATFRGTDPGAVWANDIMEKGTRRYFERDPVGSWIWYRARFAKLSEARPNAGHYALAAIEAWQHNRGADFLLVTQNIDTLHGQAGSEHVVEVHGRADRLRCPRVGCENAAPRGSLPAVQVDFTAFDAAPTPATLPKCPVCGAPLRAHVLWFDEYYNEHTDYQFERALSAFSQADLILFVGTSFSVGVTAAALNTSATHWLIDPAGCDEPGVRCLLAAQEQALPALVVALGPDSARD